MAATPKVAATVAAVLVGGLPARLRMPAMRSRNRLHDLGRLVLSGVPDDPRAIAVVVGDGDVGLFIEEPGDGGRIHAAPVPERPGEGLLDLVVGVTHELADERQHGA